MYDPVKKNGQTRIQTILNILIRIQPSTLFQNHGSGSDQNYRILPDPHYGSGGLVANINHLYKLRLDGGARPLSPVLYFVFCGRIRI